MKWIKATDKPPEGKEKGTLNIKYKGKADLLIYFKGKWHWSTGSMEDDEAYPVNSESWQAIEYLDESPEPDHIDLVGHPQYTLDDILEAAKYAYMYCFESQNKDGEVPKGNILQWLMHRKGYTETSQLYSNQPPVSDAIKFTEWVIENNYGNNTSPNGDILWYEDDDPDAIHTTTELYQIFKQSITNINK